MLDEDIEMPLIPTSPRALDQKLHRIIRESTAKTFKSAMELARSIQQAGHDEFSYERRDDTYYSSATTIQKYISYAQTISLLTDTLKPTQKRAVFEGLESFQAWVGDKVITYLNSHNCSAAQIRDAMRALLQESTPRLPTPDNVLAKLKQPLARVNFMHSLTLVSLLRPQVLGLGSRRLIISEQVMKITGPNV